MLAYGKVLLLTLVVAVLFGVGWHPAHAGPREESAIRALIVRWSKAAQEKNVDAVMSIYQRGPSLVAYDLVPPLQFKGWDAYRDDFKAFFDQYDGPIEFEWRDLVIAAGGTFGYSHGLQRVSGTLKGGQKAAFWLRVTDVYRKIGGQWRVVHEHVSVPTNLETGKAALDLTP
jgi:ketosteroid isomerase-like protein